MPWNPQQYNTFKNIRFQPFYDLITFINPDNVKDAIDIGCGTGEQTKILSEKLIETHFTGIDSSEEMLKDAHLSENERLHFEINTTENIIEKGKKWDLIFSNAALQWSDNHENLFPQLLQLLNENGQFAVQMPMQNENILNQLLLDIADEEPFKTYLNGWQREYPLLTIDQYTTILFQAELKDIVVMEKVYPIIADDVKTLFDFIAGSALVPYMEKLSEPQQQEFSRALQDKIAKAFPTFPAIYAFKRILLYGRKG